MARRRFARLAHARVQTDVGDHALGRAKASDVTDGGHEGSRRDEAHPGNAHQPADLIAAKCLRGEFALDQADLVIEEVDLPEAALDGLALVGGKLQRGQPLPSRLAEDVAHRRAAPWGARPHPGGPVLCSCFWGAPPFAAAPKTPPRPRAAGGETPGGEPPARTP